MRLKLGRTEQGGGQVSKVAQTLGKDKNQYYTHRTFLSIDYIQSSVQEVILIV